MTLTSPVQAVLPAGEVAPRYRIAQVFYGRPRPDSTSGVDKTAYFLSRALADAGSTVKIFSLTTKGAIEVPGVEVEAFRPWSSPLSIPRELARSLSAFRPDLIHLHSVYIPANTAVAAWARRNDIPYIVRPAGGLAEAAEKRRRLGKRLYKRLFELRMLNEAAFVHSVGDGGAISAYGVAARIVDVPKGVDLPEDASSDRRWLDERLPQTRGRRAVTFIGRLDPDHKGLDLLVDAFELLRPEKPVLLLAGPDHGGGEALLKERVRRAGLTDSVVFLGPVIGGDKAGLLAATDLFVHTSRWEGGIPNSVLEAAAAARPLLLTPGADREGILSAHSAAIGVEANASSIAAGIRAFLELPLDRAQALGDDARQLVETQYGWDKSAQKLLGSVADHIGAPA